MSGEPEIVYRYTGGGTAWYPGVPARDLTAEDVALLPPHEVTRLAMPHPDGTALYEAVGQPKAKTEPPKTETKPDAKPAGPAKE